MNINISDALSPLSPQKYVALRKVMIAAEYQRMLLLFREEEQLIWRPWREKLTRFVNNSRRVFQND